MPSFQLRHFANAEVLRTIRPQYLIELLGKHADYFAKRGVDLNALSAADPDYEVIAGVLIAPDQPPSSLIDDLYYVEEMASASGMDALLDAATEAKLELDLGDGPTPADVAVQMRLRAPLIVEQKHAERMLECKRSFVYFQPKEGSDITFRMPGANKIWAFEEELGGLLNAMKRGRTCKLFIFRQERRASLLVRRGDPYRREGAVEKTRTSVYYRPEKYDVLRYDEILGELSINAEGNKKLVEHYRALVGELLFGDAEHFPGTAKFTLAPLQDIGSDCLICSDVEGIDSVVLKEIQICRGGCYGDVEILRSKDLFTSLAERGRRLPSGHIVKASFLVKFTGQKTPRTVTIRPSNIASYARSEDSAPVEQWLMNRRFFRSTTLTESHDENFAQASSWA